MAGDSTVRAHPGSFGLVMDGWWNWAGWPTPSEWSALWGFSAVVLAAVAGWVAVRQLGVVVAEREERDRPHLAVDFEFRSTLVLIALRNLSGKLATNVRLTASPPIVSSHSEHFSGKLGAVFGGQEKIAQLAPGRKMAWFFDRAPDRLASTTLPKRYEITVSYDDPTAREAGWLGLLRLEAMTKNYTEVFVLDLSQYGEAATEQDHDNKMWNIATRNERRFEAMKNSSVALAQGISDVVGMMQNAAHGSQLSTGDPAPLPDVVFLGEASIGAEDAPQPARTHRARKPRMRSARLRPSRAVRRQR